MDISKLKVDIERCDAFVFDGDDTTWRDRAMKGYGGKLIPHEILRGPKHWGHAWHGIKRYGDVLEAAKRSDADGLKEFFDIVGEIQCADRDFAYNATKAHIWKHRFEGVPEFIEYLNRIGDVYIVTVSSDIAVDAAKDTFGFADGAGNPVTYYDPEEENPIIKGCEIKIRDGADKLNATKTLLEEHGYLLENCGVFGDSVLDSQAMGAAKLSIASPAADHKVIEYADHHIQNYETFAGALEKLGVLSAK